MKFIKKAIAVFLVVLTILSSMSTTVFAEEKKVPSGIRYGDIETAISDFVNEHKDTTKAMAMAIYDNDGIVYKKSLGYADESKKLAVDDNTVFEWGSVSKLMIWISAMQLHEQDKLDLNEDIKVYLPEGFLKNLTYDKKITMLELMNHQAGFQETYFTESLYESDITTLEEALSKNQPKQVFEPGTVTAYSNWGATLGAFIVENISGMDYADYITKNILKPLDMKHTAVSATLNDNPWVKKQRDSLTCFDPLGNELENKGKCYIHLYPAGSITGTLDDFLKFAQAITPNKNKPCPLFENQKTFKELLAPTSYYGDSGVSRLCHGFMVNQYAVETIGHGGNTRACSSMLLFDPESSVGMVVMTNQAAEMIYNSEMYKIIFGSFTDSKLTNIKRDIPKGLLYGSRGIKEGPLSMFSAIDFACFSEEATNEWWYQQGNQVNYSVMDFSVNTAKVIFNIALILLFVLASVYAVFTLIGGGLIISPIQKRLRRKKGIEVKHSFRKWNYAICGAMSVIFANMAMIIERIMIGSGTGDMGTPNSYFINSLIIAVTAIVLIVMVVCTLISIIKKRVIDTKTEKAKYILTVIFAVFMFIAVFVFDMYQFWAI